MCMYIYIYTIVSVVWEDMILNMNICLYLFIIYMYLYIKQLAFNIIYSAIF